MRKPLAILVLSLATIACGTVGLLQPVPTVTPTLTQTTAPAVQPTVSPTPETLATDTVRAVIVGSWNLRATGAADGKWLAYLCNGTEIEIIISTGGWLFVQTVQANPDDVLTGWVNAKSIGE